MTTSRTLSGGRKKSNGHKMNCGCPICKNMNKSKKRGGADDEVIDDVVADEVIDDVVADEVADDVVADEVAEGEIEGEMEEDADLFDIDGGKRRRKHKKSSRRTKKNKRSKKSRKSRKHRR
jgi:hypothetical protein